MPTPRSSTRRSRSAVRLRSKSAKSPSKTSKKSLTIRGGASASSIPQPPGLLRRTFPSFPWPIVPDLLTYLRLFSIPLVMFLFNFPFPTTWNLPFNHRHAVAFIYALASYTDYLDGYLARRWSVTSPFGAFLDPVADKLMVSTTLILLSGLYGTLISIPTSVIIAREIGVSALREWMSGKGLRDIVKVGWAGKAKTALTMVASTLLLALSPTYRGPIEDNLWKLAIAGIYASAVLTVTSGLGYFDAAKGELMQGRKVG